MKENNSLPLVSVIIACYNAQDTISRAIESAMAQDWTNLEIIVVDDCSSDQSVKVIEEHCLKDSRIRLMRLAANLGAGGARNAAILEAKGDFIVIFDDDDKSLPSRVTCQYKTILEAEKKYQTRMIACFASGMRIYSNGHQVDMKIVGETDPVPHGESMARYLLFYKKEQGISYGGTPACAFMMRKDIFCKIDMFDPDFRRIEDIDFAVRFALAKGYFIGTGQKILVQYATSGNDKKPESSYAARLMLIEKHKEFLLKNKRYHYAKQWAYMRHCHFSGQKAHFFYALIALFVCHPIWGTGQFLQTGSRRFIHELKIKKAA
ncbi:MAG: glycosyl transferase [Micavibrio aeruginosavorus]|uniref:Glycosyl transferase n=1 Tax=Micavibrio aeruginosavorus TaxID=349221 RepID=A0A2W5MXD0_9BACT|nr:MAG: glycosyl transferase [Micavibrio aeruginosavorus]